MLELIAASAILAVLLIVCAQMLSRTAVQQQGISNRRAATQMTVNAMERVWALPWREMEEEALKRIAATVLAEKMLRRAQVEVVVDDLEGKPASKRIRVTVTWREGSNGIERQQQLTAWRYADNRGSSAERAGPDRRPDGEVPP